MPVECLARGSEGVGAVVDGRTPRRGEGCDFAAAGLAWCVSSVVGCGAQLSGRCIRAAAAQLSSVTAADVMTQPRLVIDADTRWSKRVNSSMTPGVRGAPVIGNNDELLGVLSSDALDQSGDLLAGAVADRTYPTVPLDRGLDIALDVMVSAGVGWVPVIDGRRVAGIVAMSEVIGSYQHALRRSTRLLADITGDTALVEAAIADTSVFVDTTVATTVATAPWPRGSFALSVDRNSQLIAPRPDTTLHAGDVVVTVVPLSAEAELRHRLTGGGLPPH